MQPLAVTLIQAPLIWENPIANKSYFEPIISSLNETNIVILPEMFTTGFSMNSKKLAETEPGETLIWLKKLASKKNVAITGSIIVEENYKYYNRLYWVNPDESYVTYDKKHLFRMAGENAFFNNGNKRVIVNFKGWNICPMICYDLRFPVWIRNKFKNNLANKTTKPQYDLLVFVANWPEIRVNAWSTLLAARAIENQCFTVGVNRIGQDANGITYNGKSEVFDFKGQSVLSFLPNQEGIKTVVLNPFELLDFREKFPVGFDADNFKLL